MAKYLVIVESPTKAKTISAILGKEYEVASSMGHIVDLPSNKLSVDVDGEFEPVYRIIPGKEKIIKELKKKSKGKDIIYLATDPDREGEAISWHLKERLSARGKKFYRVTFHEITEEALHEAFKKHGHLDMHKVNAQVARRVLDRIVGYKLSPILWKRIVRGLSAGRVQSIALKFIVERENEISSFVSKTTFSVEAKFRAGSDIFSAKLVKFKGKKLIFDTEEDALSCIKELKDQNFQVKSLTSKETKRKPPPPYITSSLQQDAFNRLRFSAQKAMLLAQKLYEGAKINNKSVGLITYMRTDSFHVSPKAKVEAKEFISSNFGKAYLSQHDYHHKKKKGAQLAHEAIRPTSIHRGYQDIIRFVSEDEAKLYGLIWKRFLAVFMAEAVFESTRAIVSSAGADFQANGRKVIFEGYLKAFSDESEQNPLPEFSKGQAVALEDLEAVAHTTKPSPRYNDASLIKLLEEKGIGRPSTYAPTVYTLIRRYYIKKEKRAFIPTDLGIKVCNLLVQYFSQIIDESFTAFMEEKLDEVEKGAIEWHHLLRDFYPKFNEKVEKTLATIKKEIEYSNKQCPKCKARLIIKWSRRGRFLSCESFPKCRYAESISSGVACPDCKQGQLVERRNRRGQDFYGCSGFPKCTYTSRTLPEDSAQTEDK